MFMQVGVKLLPKRIVRTRLTRCAGAVLLMVAYSGWSADARSQQPFDQARALEALASGSSEERTAAIAAIKKVPVDQRDGQLVAALLQELERLHQALEERQRALLAGQPLAPSEDRGEYLFSVLEVVTEHKNAPEIIRPLLPFIGTGNRVVDTVAEFGELAVPDVAGIAASPFASPTDVHSALLVFRRMLERPGAHPLSASSRAQIAKVAGERLTGVQKDTVIVNAVDLAVATGDPPLLQRVARLAQEPAAMEALGIEPNRVAALQKIASDALAGRRKR